MAQTQDAAKPVSQVQLRVGYLLEIVNRNNTTGVLDFELSNRGDRPVATQSLGVRPNCITIIRPSNQKIEDCSTVDSFPSTNKKSASPKFPQISPQSSKTWLVNYQERLNLLYDLREPGIYRLQWNWNEVSSTQTTVDIQIPEFSFLRESPLIRKAPGSDIYEKPVAAPNDIDAPPPPKAAPPPKPADSRLKTNAPLEMAAVLDAPAPTIAFIFSNDSKAAVSVAPLGATGNGFTVVTPTGRIVRQTLKAQTALALEPQAQKIWKVEMRDWFKANKLDAPGWYQLWWKVGEQKTGPLWLVKTDGIVPTK